MDIIGIIGLVMALVLMVFGVTFSMTTGINFANLINFIDYPSVAITIGGTFAVLMISFPVESFIKIPKHLKIVFMPEKYDPMSYITSLTEFAKEARIKGLLSIESKLASVKDDFLKRSLMLVVDSIDAEKVHQILDDELNYIEERHVSDIEFYQREVRMHRPSG